MSRSSTQTKGARQQRLKILGQDEIDFLFRRPCFTQQEREQYFTLSASEQAVLDKLKTIQSKVAFILQLGYFKARHMFFVFTTHDVAEDLNHVVERYFRFCRKLNANPYGRSAAPIDYAANA